MCEVCDEIAAFAKWTRAYINSLPDSSFAVIEPAYSRGDTDNKNARHLPHHNEKGGGAKNVNLDLPHLRNAMARANQIKPVTDSIEVDALREKAMSHLENHRDAIGKSETFDGDYVLMDAKIIGKDEVVLKDEFPVKELLIEAFEAGEYPDLNYSPEVCAAYASTFQSDGVKKKYVLYNHAWHDVTARIGYIGQSWFNQELNKIIMRVYISDPDAIDRIHRGLLNEVSVGMIVKADEERKNATSFVGMELSFVNFPQCKSCGIIQENSEIENQAQTCEMKMEEIAEDKPQEQQEVIEMDEEKSEEQDYRKEYEKLLKEKTELQSQLEVSEGCRTELKQEIANRDEQALLVKKQELIDKLVDLGAIARDNAETLEKKDIPTLEILLDNAEFTVRRTSVEPKKKELEGDMITFALDSHGELVREEKAFMQPNITKKQAHEEGIKLAKKLGMTKEKYPFFKFLQEDE